MIHSKYHLQGAQVIVIRYITAQLLWTRTGRTKFYNNHLREDCMSIQMVPREETELHRKHSHSIIVSLEAWLAWDGRRMISWPEYIYIHKQTPQQRIAIKATRKTREKNSCELIFTSGTHDFQVFRRAVFLTHVINKVHIDVTKNELVLRHWQWKYIV